MNRVVELSDEEVSCIETGLHYLGLYDKEFAYSDYISDLIMKLHNSKIYIGGRI